MDLPSWLDAPKIAGLTVLVLAFVQYLKVYIPEKYIKLFAIGIGIVLSILCELYIGAVMNWVKAVVNGAVASIVADLGYSFLSKTGAKFALPSKTELTNNEKKEVKP